MFAFRGASISWCTVVFSVLSKEFVSSCYFSLLYVVISVKLITVLSLSSISNSERFMIIVLEPSPRSSFMMQDSTRSSRVFGIIRSYLSDTSSFVLVSLCECSFSTESLKTKCLNLGMSIGLQITGLNVST